MKQLILLNNYMKKFNVKTKLLNIETIINNEKITDHHTIIPTQNISIEKLKENEKQVYYIIVKRLLESVHNKVKGYTYKFIFTIDNINFYSKYDYIVEKGFTEVEKS